MCLGKKVKSTMGKAVGHYNVTLSQYKTETYFADSLNKICRSVDCTQKGRSQCQGCCDIDFRYMALPGLCLLVFAQQAPDITLPVHKQA